MIKIGLSLREIEIDNVKKEFINQSYINYLNKYNVIIILLSNTTKNLNELLNMCDGFILCGGNDIDPKYYNEENTNSDFCEYNDLLDKKIIEHSYKKNKPLLGICRGMQSINVFLGGSLNQNIKNHYRVLHDVYINKNTSLGSKLKKIIKANSFHHQSINRLASDIEVVGKTFDNTYEIIEHRFKPIIAVQYHPEILLNDKSSKDLFDYFMMLLNVRNHIKNSDD